MAKRGASEGLPERNKRLAREVAERTIRQVELVRGQLQIHPYDAPELDEEQQMALYSEVRNDPGALAALIATDRELFRLRPDRAPKRLVRELEDMEERYQEWVGGRSSVEMILPLPVPGGAEEGASADPEA